jgi:hypothetical protein
MDPINSASQPQSGDTPSTDHPAFGNIETPKIPGSEVRIYSDVRDFAAALESSAPDRIMTTTTPMLFACTYSAAFIDERGVVHGISINPCNGRDDVQPLYAAIESRGIQEVDGTIRTSVTSGDVYHIFAPDSDKELSIQQNYDAFIAAAIKMADAGDAVARVAIIEDQALLNIQRGKHHLITPLPLEGERSLENTVARFPGIPVSNESWLVEIRG